MPPLSSRCSPATSSIPGRPIKRSKGRFACSKCPAIFDKQVRYNVHINLHGSAHRFQCDKCDYAVKFAAILIRHKALHETEKMGGTQVSTLSLTSNSVTTLAPENVNDAPLTIVVNSNSSTLESDSFLCHSELTTVEKQQLLFRALQSKPVVAGEFIESVSELKKLFCCDRCPYVHQRKDAVQSHFKRHTLTVRDFSFCPHCDYGTSIHSFMREHIKLHFKPLLHHKPEAFIRWEEFKVWAQSSLRKTLVYEYQFNQNRFHDEDVIDISIQELIENLKLEEEAKDIVAVVFDILSKVEVYNRNISLDISGDAADSVLTIHSESCKNTPEVLSAIQQPMLSDTCVPGYLSLRDTNVFDYNVCPVSLPIFNQPSQLTTNSAPVNEMSDFIEFALCLGYSA